MLGIGDRVKVIDENSRYYGAKGIIKSAHNDLDVETVYTIKYEDSPHSGMFPESHLERRD